MNLSGQGVVPETSAITYIQGVRASGSRTDIQHPSRQYAIGRRGSTRATPAFPASLAFQRIHLTAWTRFVVHPCVEHAMLYAEASDPAVLPLIEEMAPEDGSVCYPYGIHRWFALF